MNFKCSWLLLSFAILLAIFGNLQVEAASRKGKKSICYYNSDAVYRPGGGQMLPDSIKHTCDYLIYGYIGVGIIGNIKILDLQRDIVNGGFSKFSNLVNNNHPDLKKMIAVGGPKDGSKHFSKVCKNNGMRKNFANNLYNFVVKYGFDGVDLAWEFPTENGGSPEDRVNFSLLLKELRAIFEPAGLLLSASVTGNILKAPLYYEFDQLASYLNFINLMTYDYHDSSENVLGFNSPHFGADSSDVLNIESTIQFWLQYVPAANLSMGAPFFGKTFTFPYPEFFPGSPSSGPGLPGKYLNIPGIISYGEYCVIDGVFGWSSAMSPQQESLYTFNEDGQWISYDSYVFMAKKGVLASNYNLGGVTSYSIDMDDHELKCGTPSTLLTTLLNGFEY